MATIEAEVCPACAGDGFIPVREISDDDPTLVEDFDPPNLDGCDDDDLEAFSLVFSLLAAYAGHLGHARRHRREGDIECALSFERRAEHIYNQLPEWAKW